MSKSTYCRDPLCVQAHLDQKVEWGCSLKGSNAQVPAARGGRLGFGCRCWADWVSEHSCWGGSTLCIYTHMYSLEQTILTNQGGKWNEVLGAVCVSMSAACVGLCGQPCAFTMCMLACVPTSPALLPAGPGAMQLWQPHFSRATGFGNSLT